MIQYKPIRRRRPVESVRTDIKNELLRLPIDESLRLEEVWLVLRRIHEKDLTNSPVSGSILAGDKDETAK